MRNRPLHALPSASLPRITRLSHNPLPTVEARPRRTRGSEREGPLWAARRTYEWSIQRIVVFVLV